MWDVIDDLMFEIENFSETVRYCKTHNNLIKKYSIEEIERMFWDRVRREIGSLKINDLEKVEEQMLPVFNASYIISVPSGGCDFPMVNGKRPKKHMINFFVRLGRRAAVELVK